MQSERKLLIVEDQKPYAELIRHTMEDVGWMTTIADNLTMALQVANGFTAITLDLNLPDSKGTEGIVKLRSKYPTIPLIVVSGYSNLHQYADLIAMGADACIPKPPDVVVLPALIDKAIRLRDYRASLIEMQKCWEQLG